MASRHELLFDVRRSVRYHTRRRQFFDKWSKIFKFITVLSGTATFATALATLSKTWTLGSAVVVALFSTIDLIIGTSEKARLHTDLANKFIELEKDIVVASEELEELQLSELTARRLDIEAEEPPIKRILDSICHNELLRAMGYNESMQVKIRWYQRWFVNFIDIRLHSIKQEHHHP